MGLSMILTCSPTTTWTVTPVSITSRFDTERWCIPITIGSTWTYGMTIGHSQIISHWDHPPPTRSGGQWSFCWRTAERSNWRALWRGRRLWLWPGSGGALAAETFFGPTVPRENHPLNPVPKRPVIDQWRPTHLILWSQSIEFSCTCCGENSRNFG